MKRRDLIKALADIAEEKGVAFVWVREGGSHSVYRFGSANVAIPRHADINERLARAIIREAQRG